MSEARIHQLSEDTIDKIAAGEVVERPSSVVKELVENAIDAGASAITTEIRDGGTSLIRVTDNGYGIASDEVPKAFLRHATSKIDTAEDLRTVRSLGFRGEALSSIAAVSKVEMITKRQEDITATHYVIEGAREVSCDEIGGPEGTSIFVRQIFYNTPARRKFLKSPMTEGNYINEIMERLALSHPSVSFRFVTNGTEKLATAGNGNLKDAIYEVYGRSIARELLPVSFRDERLSISGYIGTPQVHRGNRAFESFFVGGRFIKSRILQRAIEEGYVGFLMQHMYPFCVLNLEFVGEGCDVNVHPTKQDVRFFDEQVVYDLVKQAVHTVLTEREDIAQVPLKEDKRPKPETVPMGAEPFETNRLLEMKEKIQRQIRNDSPYSRQYDYRSEEMENSSLDAAAEPVSHRIPTDTVAMEGPFLVAEKLERPEGFQAKEREEREEFQTEETGSGQKESFSTEGAAGKPQQLSFLSEEAKPRHRIVGEVFGTFWIVEYENSMYIIDQHAAHEKVLYERFMEQLSHQEMTSQYMSPPEIVSLSLAEEGALRRFDGLLKKLGFSVSHFGGKDYAIDAIPGNLPVKNTWELFLDVIALWADNKRLDEESLLTEKVASMSCKAAVKGNHHLSFAEAEALIDELLTLDNPYHCPHGRPTIISMTHYELDKRFKR
ncbi:MAG: DNA mismatch repair endonuclease MutL, partial [Lachnospiraceae bacterium]|nr:DNA mismatch repair endonuclease MutL [Lachnospiraceae bacterium]